MTEPPVAPPDDLTIPREGSTTAREVLSAYLRHQYRTLLTTPYEVLTGDPTTATAFRHMVRELARSSPGAVFAALRQPTIGGLLRLIAVRAGARDELAAWSEELFAQFCFEMAVSGLGDATLPLTRPCRRLIALSEGVALDLPANTRRLRFTAGSLVVDSGDGERTYDLASREGLGTPFRALLGGSKFALVDNNPRASMEAHPEKSGNDLDLGGHSADVWVESLDAALAIIDEHLPVLAPEMRLMLHQIVPVGYHAERHFSASLMEVVGNIYMSLHPDVLTLAEAIVHEFSHNKINALWTLQPMLENAFEPLYPSPVRPDPRPLFGVLLAVHAFLPVEQMYFSLASSDHPLRDHPRFEARRRQIRALMDEGSATVLTHGVPTSMGAPLLDEIRRVNAAHASALG